jgi:quinol monooxygenase YgiN
MLLDKIRHEKGCLRCNVYQDMENENAFIFIEEWKTEAHLDKHLRSDRFGVLIGAVKLLSDTSEIKFTTLAQTTEIEAIRRFTN